VNCLSCLSVAFEVFLLFLKFFVFMMLLLSMVVIDGCCICCSTFPIGTFITSIEIPKIQFITTVLHQPLTG